MTVGRNSPQFSGLGRDERRTELEAAKRFGAVSESVATVTAGLADAVADIATNTSDIADNAAAIAALPDIPVIGGGTVSGTTNASSIITFSHGLGVTPDAVVIQPISPNGGGVGQRFQGVGGVAVDSTTVTVGRCASQDGSTLTNTAVSFFWIAFKA